MEKVDNNASKKSNGKGQFSKEWFIERYGEEEGLKKYNEKCNKARMSAMGRWTEEWCIKKYGEEEGLKKYKEYHDKLSQSMKNVASKEWYIKKYGEEEGLERYNKRCKNISKNRKGKMTKEWFIERYGEEEGLKKYNEWCSDVGKSSKLRTKEYYYDRFIKKYGEEEGLKKYNEWYVKLVKCKEHFIKRFGEEEGLKRYNKWSKTQARGKEFFIKKYGEEEGIERWQKKINHWTETLNSKSLEEKMEINKKKLLTLENFIRKFGENDGTIKFNSIITRRFENFDKNILDLNEYIEKYGEKGKKLYEKRKNEMKKRKTLVAFSKKSWLIFKDIHDWLEINDRNYDIKYGFLGELCLENKELSKTWYYDFSIEDLKLIIEYNGSRFHPNKELLTEEEWKNWKSLYSNKSADEVYNNEVKKISFAKESGYNVLIIWDNVSREENIEICKKFILERENEVNGK